MKIDNILALISPIALWCAVFTFNVVAFAPNSIKYFSTFVTTLLLMILLIEKNKWQLACSSEEEQAIDKGKVEISKFSTPTKKSYENEGCINWS